MAHQEDCTSIFFQNFAGNRPQYNRGPLRATFNRLANKFSWGDEEYRERWNECLVSEIKWWLYINPEDGKATRLRKLCAAFEIYVDDNAGVKECEDHLRFVYVNILDWLDSMRKNKPIRYFSSKGQLRRFTTRRRMYFPRAVLKEMPFLRPLLQTI